MNTFLTFKDPLGTSWNFKGDSIANKISCCLTLAFAVPHEMGHYLAAKCYGYDVFEAAFESKGAHVTRGKRFSIIENGLSGLLPLVIENYFPSKKTQHHRAMICMAGPISSIAFHTLGLLRLLAKKERDSILIRFPLYSYSSRIILRNNKFVKTRSWRFWDFTKKISRVSQNWRFMPCNVNRNFFPYLHKVAKKISEEDLLMPLYCATQKEKGSR